MRQYPKQQILKQPQIWITRPAASAMNHSTGIGRTFAPPFFTPNRRSDACISLMSSGVAGASPLHGSS